MAVVTFDNSADGAHANSHSRTLGCVESVKDLVRIARVNSDASTLNCQTHVIVFVFLGPDQQIPETIVDAAHCVRRAPEQVEDHLLKLDEIPGDKRKIAGELRSQNRPLSP